MNWLSLVTTPFLLPQRARDGVRRPTPCPRHRVLGQPSLRRLCPRRRRQRPRRPDLSALLGRGDDQASVAGTAALLMDHPRCSRARCPSSSATRRHGARRHRRRQGQGRPLVGRAHHRRGPARCTSSLPSSSRTVCSTSSSAGAPPPSATRSSPAPSSGRGRGVGPPAATTVRSPLGPQNIIRGLDSATITMRRRVPTRSEQRKRQIWVQSMRVGASGRNGGVRIPSGALGPRTTSSVLTQRRRPPPAWWGPSAPRAQPSSLTDRGSP